MLKKIFTKKSIYKKIFLILLFFLTYNTPGHPCVSTKKNQQKNQAVWPAVGNIYIYKCLLLLYR